MTGLKTRGLDSAVLQESRLVDPVRSGEEGAERGDQTNSFGH